MSSFEIKIDWNKNATEDFKYDIFSRKHNVYFSGNQILNNSSAPEFLGNTDASNPEELLAASLASCHMLTFLAVASKSGYIVEKYSSKAIALLNKNEEGKTAVTEINLYPEIIFSGTKIPDEAQLKSLHDKSHRNCFIAQSIKTKVNIF